MPRGIWNGDIHFGLVYIPVTLFSAESHDCDVKLHLVDKRDLAPIGFQKINKKTGEKVPSDQIAEAYEYEDKDVVILSKEDLKKFHPQSSQSIEILEFVDRDAINPEYYEKPYYLQPRNKSDHGYALLREALRKSNKMGIAKVVIRTKQYLSALMVEEKAIILELLRFPCELVPQKQFDLPQEDFSKSPVAKKELKIAEALIKSMSARWNPKKYKNEYQGSVIDFVMEKIKMGKSYSLEEKRPKPGKQAGKVIDIMDLLKKSLNKTKIQTKPTGHKVAHKR